MPGRKLRSWSTPRRALDLPGLPATGPPVHGCHAGAGLHRLHGDHRRCRRPVLPWRMVQLEGSRHPAGWLRALLPSPPPPTPRRGLPMNRPNNRRAPVKEVGPDPIDVMVGLRIPMRRKTLGLTQGALAEALGLSFQQVQKYERGANRVSASMLVKTARFLDCPVAYFVDEEALESTTPDQAGQMMQPGAMEALKAYTAIPPHRRLAVLNLMRSLAKDENDSDDTPAPRAQTFEGAAGHA